MTAQRLNNDMRMAIVAAATKDVFGARCADWRRRYSELVDEIITAGTPKHYREHVKALPLDYLNTSHAKPVRLNGIHAQLAFLHRPDDTSGSMENLTAYRVRGFAPGIDMTVNDDQLRNRYEAIMAEKQKLEDEVVGARMKLQALLKSVTTFKRLREVWPEGEFFYKPFEQERRSPPLPVPISQLNEIFKVPREEEVLS